MKKLTGRVGFDSQILQKEDLEPAIELLNGGESFKDAYKLGKISYRTSGNINVIKCLSIKEREEKVAKIYRYQ